MRKNIGILGGDLRILKLAQMLSLEEYIIYTYGIEGEVLNSENIVKCNSITELCKVCNNIVSAIPFSKDGIYINTPLSNKKIKINDLLKLLTNKRIIAGAVKQEIKEEAIKNNVDILDLIDDEGFNVLNTIPTVEGAIQIAMENTKFTIHSSNSLVLGYGRIGKLLSKTLKDLGSNVSVMARSNKDLSWINLYGYRSIHISQLGNNLSGYDIIFNTVPALILDDRKLKQLEETKSNTIIIELASNPGGIDFIKAEEYSVKVIKALGLPGKVAPYTAAKFIKEALDRILN